MLERRTKFVFKLVKWKFWLLNVTKCGKCSPAKFVFYIFTFTTKLCDFTNFKILFLSVVMDSFAGLDQN